MKFLCQILGLLCCIIRADTVGFAGKYFIVSFLKATRQSHSLLANNISIVVVSDVDNDVTVTISAPFRRRRRYVLTQVVGPQREITFNMPPSANVFNDESQDKGVIIRSSEDILVYGFVADLLTWKQSVFPVFPSTFMGSDYLVSWNRDNQILMVSDISKLSVQISTLKLLNHHIPKVLETLDISINMPFNGTSVRAFHDGHQLHAVKVNTSAPIALLIRTTDDKLNKDKFASYYMSFPPWICGKKFVTLPTRNNQWKISVRITATMRSSKLTLYSNKSYQTFSIIPGLVYEYPVSSRHSYMIIASENVMVTQSWTTPEDSIEMQLIPCEMFARSYKFVVTSVLEFSSSDETLLYVVAEANRFSGIYLNNLTLLEVSSATVRSVAASRYIVWSASLLETGVMTLHQEMDGGHFGVFVMNYRPSGMFSFAYPAGINMEMALNSSLFLKSSGASLFPLPEYSLDDGDGTTHDKTLNPSSTTLILDNINITKSSEKWYMSSSHLVSDNNDSDIVLSIDASQTVVGTTVLAQSGVFLTISTEFKNYVPSMSSSTDIAYQRLTHNYMDSIHHDNTLHSSMKLHDSDVHLLQVTEAMKSPSFSHDLHTVFETEYDTTSYTEIKATRTIISHSSITGPSNNERPKCDVTTPKNNFTTLPSENLDKTYTVVISNLITVAFITPVIILVIYKCRKCHLRRIDNKNLTGS